MQVLMYIELLYASKLYEYVFRKKNKKNATKQ